MISVVIVDSRSKEHPEWVEKAVGSVKEQALDGMELIILDNTERKYSIGRMYNQGLELAENDWVYFLGDDDFVSPDFFMSLASFIKKFADEDTVVCTTYSTFFDDDKRVSSINTMTPMGAFKRDYFLEHPLDEKLIRYIDVEAYQRFKKDGKKAKVCRWHFGYYYRQHEDNISGRKHIKSIPQDNGNHSLSRECEVDIGQEVG